MNKDNQVKELAAKVLNVFGYINMQPEYITVLDYTEVIVGGYFDYILVSDGKQKYELSFEFQKNKMSWDLEVK